MDLSSLMAIGISVIDIGVASVVLQREREHVAQLVHQGLVPAYYYYYYEANHHHFPAHL